MKLLKIAALGLFVSALSGCDDEFVSVVKNGKLGVDPSITIAEAFERRDICDEVSWTSFNAKGKMVVEYRCTLNGVESYFDDLFEMHLERNVERFEKSVEGFTATKEEYEEKRDSYKEQAEELAGISESDKAEIDKTIEKNNNRTSELKVLGDYLDYECHDGYVQRVERCISRLNELARIMNNSVETADKDINKLKRAPSFIEKEVARLFSFKKMDEVVQFYVQGNNIALGYMGLDILRSDDSKTTVPFDRSATKNLYMKHLYANKVDDFEDYYLKKQSWFTEYRYSFNSNLIR